MHDTTLIHWILVVSLAGVLAHLLTPGRDSAGWGLVPILGAAGTIVAAVATDHLGLPALSGLDLYTVLCAGAGAMCARLCYRIVADA